MDYDDIMIDGKRSRSIQYRDGRLVAKLGTTIGRVCEDMVKLARLQQADIKLDFNGIAVTATPTSDPAALFAEWSAETDRRHEAYLNSEEYRAQMAAVARKEAEQSAALADLLDGRPDHMEVRDAEEWQSYVNANRDPYGAACIAYAERWARCMEACMDKGEAIEDCAKRTSHLADTEGITGFMYGAAVSMLSKCWIYGEPLRQWHNLDIQPGTAGQAANESGGVLNPALLSIG